MTSSNPKVPTTDRELLLLSAPWASHRTPSMQLGALKAYAAREGIPVRADHFFLRVAAWLGLETYSQIWAPILEDGEALYGALLFPEHLPDVLASPGLNAKSLSVTIDGEAVTLPSRRFFRGFAEMHERALNAFDFSRIALVGLTLNFGQTLASAYIAARIKARAPHVKVIIGGAEATGELGRSLLEMFPQFDFACSGEGERALVELYRAINEDDWDAIPASVITYREAPQRTTEIQRISDLPTPDFDEYFELLSDLALSATDVCEYLPFETSRGCYYTCTFCSLNLQWNGYRQADPLAIAEKVETLRRRHGRLGFFFVDNITPVGVKHIAAALSDHGVDYRLFYEARVNLDRATWQALAEAGLRTTQLGIEALSDDLLRLYNKKSTVLHNLQALKHCYEFGITVSGNIILDHPLSKPEHVRQSLEAFEYVRAFPPALSFSHYALLVGAPDYLNGLESVEVVGNYSGYQRAYPNTALQSLNLPRKEFVRRDEAPRADFSSLVDAIEAWERRYSSLQARFGGREPIMSLQDGGDFLRIEDWRSGERVIYDLDERERKVYLALDTCRRLDDIPQATSLDANWVAGALATFHAERLAYIGGGRGLSLALRKRGAPS